YLFLAHLLSHCARDHRYLHSFPTRRSSDLRWRTAHRIAAIEMVQKQDEADMLPASFRSNATTLPRTATIVRDRRHVADRGDGEADRKSTRLNSSHVSISYAVLCLKKK